MRHLQLAAMLALPLLAGCGSSDDCAGEEYTVGGSHICEEPTSDGGKPCRNDVECEAWCEAVEEVRPGTEVEGACSYVTQADCFQHVNDGIAGGKACY